MNEMLVMDREWDYLIILDACRYDYFEQVNKIPGELHKVRSAGSETRGWVRGNFKKRYDNVMYISASPFASKLWCQQNIKIVPFEFVDLWLTNWDEKLKTVKAEVVTKEAMEQKRKGHRMIVHYLQPHWPFIGEIKLSNDGVERWRERMMGKTNEKRLDKIWIDFYAKKIRIDEIKEGYRSNLEYVMFHVEQLVKELQGKIVITSDHGTSFGEMGFYAHPPRDVPVLRDVPWLIVR